MTIFYYYQNWNSGRNGSNISNWDICNNFGLFLKIPGKEKFQVIMNFCITKKKGGKHDKFKLSIVNKRKTFNPGSVRLKVFLNFIILKKSRQPIGIDYCFRNFIFIHTPGTCWQIIINRRTSFPKNFICSGYYCTISNKVIKHKKIT